MHGGNATIGVKSSVMTCKHDSSASTLNEKKIIFSKSQAYVMSSVECLDKLAKLAKWCLCTGHL